ncbi:unnamed protein product [Closterium sp. NIES-65]|nr:unnamed protein product [Closterium sp. NIES-65]
MSSNARKSLTLLLPPAAHFLLLPQPQIGTFGKLGCADNLSLSFLGFRSPFPLQRSLRPSLLSPRAKPLDRTACLVNLPKGKTPGPDGLPGELFWSFRPQFTSAIHSLLLGSHEHLPPSMLQGRTVLIPKRSDASVVNNLRPITLMNSDYKILAICLANRLQPLLPGLIHHSQTAFIKSRKIGDTLNDTLDIFDWATTHSLPLLALTVDIRKAYDMVDREFLFSCLAHLGLPPPFIHWVRLMHSGTSTCISVNNMCGPPIPVLTGVRQGCPLAPLLFLCVVEMFHRYASGFLPGFPFSPTQRRLMACYADDVTIFLNSDKELRLASHALLSFASVSGEHPNWAKCSLIPFNVDPASITRAGDIPIRHVSEFERILGIFVGSSGQTDVTWNLALSKVKRSANLLSHLHATSSCRKLLASENLNSTLTFPARFQPPPSPTSKALDDAVGNFLSASKYVSAGRTTRLLTHTVLYNKLEHGGLGAIRPSIQIKALNIQRALRRLSPLPDASVARTCVPIPFGLHSFLAHPDLVPAIPPSTPIRVREEVSCLLEALLEVSSPRQEFWCLLAEPVPFNRFIVKADGRPFGRLKEEGFLFAKEVRVGHLVRRDASGARRLTNAEIMAQYPPSTYPCNCRIINEVYDAMPREWWSALASSHSLVPIYAGDWAMLAADMFSPPNIVFEVIDPQSDGSFFANLFCVDCTGRIAKEATARRLLSPLHTVPVHVFNRWLGGSFCSGAGLAARLPLLNDGFPSLAGIRDLLYHKQELTHPPRWTNMLPSPGPPLFPDYKHPFLSEQPSSQRDVLFRFYALALPFGSRFSFGRDKGACAGCSSGQLETLPHLFFECGVAKPVLDALQRTASSHLGIATPPELTLFPLSAGAGQGAPWSLLVGAAAKTIWNARCSFRYRQTTTKTGDALFQVLHYFLLAYKILLWRCSKGSKKKQAKAKRIAKLAHSYRFFQLTDDDMPIIHPDLRATWLLDDIFHPP